MAGRWVGMEGEKDKGEEHGHISTATCQANKMLFWNEGVAGQGGMRRFEEGASRSMRKRMIQDVDAPSREC